MINLFLFFCFQNFHRFCILLGCFFFSFLFADVFPFKYEISLSTMSPKAKDVEWFHCDVGKMLCKYCKHPMEVGEG